jgi:hypothetical protein
VCCVFLQYNIAVAHEIRIFYKCDISEESWIRPKLIVKFVKMVLSSTGICFPQRYTRSSFRLAIRASQATTFLTDADRVHVNPSGGARVIYAGTWIGSADVQYILGRGSR